MLQLLYKICNISCIYTTPKKNTWYIFLGIFTIVITQKPNIFTT